MKVLILSFSNNIVNEESFIPNKIGLTFSCVEECIKNIEKSNYEYEHICINKKKINKCLACGARGWGICYDEGKCIQKDDFNDIYNHMRDFDMYVFITPVYFHEMSESAKSFFDRLKRCDAFNDNSFIHGKDIICIACAGGSGKGVEETLKSFDILNYFLHTNMVGRIPVTKYNFNDKKKDIEGCLNLDKNIKIYNKMERDKIPDIISKNGENSVTKVLNDDEYKEELFKKLEEECIEVIKSKDNDELSCEIADVLEVIDSIINLEGLSLDDIKRIQEDKRESRGGFSKRIYLERTMKK